MAGSSRKTKKKDKAPVKKKFQINRSYVITSVFISLFLMLVFFIINKNIVGQAILEPTDSVVTNVTFSVVVPFLFFMIFFSILLHRFNMKK